MIDAGVMILIAVFVITWAAIGALFGYLMAANSKISQIAVNVATTAAILERVETALEDVAGAPIASGRNKRTGGA